MPFNKALASWTLEDMQYLVDVQASENIALEFKRELPCKPTEKPTQQGQIRDYAKKKICAEVVALANTVGGYLILGIEETQDHPRRAQALTPLADASTMAGRLLQILSESVRPVINGIMAQVIPSSPNGDGIIVFWVPKSTSAPHRNECDSNCYIRRDEHAVPMDMIEIQRRTLTVHREQFDGLWTADFATRHNGHIQNYGGGVVILDRGRIFGGDSGRHYIGYYNINENHLSARIQVKWFFGDPTTVWGDTSPSFSATIEATLATDKKTMRGIMRRDDYQSVPELNLVWREPLPSMRD